MDENFFPNSGQVEMVLATFVKHAIIAHVDDGTIAQVRDFTKKPKRKPLYEPSSTLEIILPQIEGFWENLMSGLKQLPGYYQAKYVQDDPQKMLLFLDKYALQPMEEVSPKTRFILLRKYFGREDVDSDLMVVMDRFKQKFASLITELEARLGIRLEITLQLC